MEYLFSPASQALLATGKLVQVTTATGQVLPILRSPVTGRFVEIAKSVVSDSAQPLVSPAQFAMSGLQMYQNHKGFTAVLDGLQSIQTSLGVLQATTALIGVGTVAGVALTAVNLHQTLKLRKEVEKLRLEVKNGFIDLKQALIGQGVEIKELIEQVAQDIKFEQHRTILVRAYGLFIQAIACLRSATQLQDENQRNSEISAARQMLFSALADYTNPHLLAETCAAGQLRRLECAWAIEQAIITTYQIQNATVVVSDRLSHLQHQIRQDVLNVVERCETEDELDFLFPEITRIHNHDLAVINSWQNHVDWMRSLPSEELQLLAISDFSSPESLEPNHNTADLATPPEQLIYENLKQKSHPLSLELQLKLMIKPELRLESIHYISQQATSVGYKALVASNLQQASDLAVANLYWYFKVRAQAEEAKVA